MCYKVFLIYSIIKIFRLDDIAAFLSHSTSVFCAEFEPLRPRRASTAVEFAFKGRLRKLDKLVRA